MNFLNTFFANKNECLVNKNELYDELINTCYLDIDNNQNSNNDLYARYEKTNHENIHIDYDIHFDDFPVINFHRKNRRVYVKGTNYSKSEMAIHKLYNQAFYPPVIFEKEIFITIESSGGEASGEASGGEASGEASGDEAHCGEINEKICSICLDSLKCKTIITPCKHEFCEECYNKLTKNSHNCPNCRADLGIKTYNTSVDYKTINEALPEIFNSLVTEISKSVKSVLLKHKKNGMKCKIQYKISFGTGCVYAFS